MTYFLLKQASQSQDRAKNWTIYVNFLSAFVFEHALAWIFSENVMQILFMNTALTHL